MAKKVKIGLKGFYKLEEQSPYRLVEVLENIISPNAGGVKRRTASDIQKEIDKFEARKKSESDPDVKKLLDAKIKTLNNQKTKATSKEGEAAKESSVEPALKKRLQALKTQVKEVVDLMDKLAEDYPDMRTANPPKVKIGG